MSESNSSQQTGIGSFICNAAGERYLFAINRNVFESTNASTVFHPHFGNSLFKEYTFYVIAGTDSGLLYQYVKTQGIPKGSCYLFVELPQVLALLEDVDGSEKLAVTSGEDWLERAKDMGAQNFAVQDRLILSRSLGMVHSHYQDYLPFWNQLKKGFDAYCYAQKMVRNEYFFITCQIINLTENQTPAICLKNTFKGKTAVLLAGGPSLDELLPWVKQHRSNLLVIAISRIGNSLLQAGIQPDICVSIDPQPVNLCISQDMLKFQNAALLVNKNHLSPDLLSSWGGQKMFIGSRYPWASSLEPENLPVSDGTSVTNHAFGLAVEMGVAQIILGGADFCYSREGYTHSNGSLEHATGPRPMVVQLQVQTNSGLIADTIHAYQASAMSIDLQAQNAINMGCRTLNPAPGAMRLPHVEHLSLNVIHVEPLEKPARDTLTDCMPPTDSKCLTRIYKEALGEIDRVLKKVKAIKALSSKALIYNRKLFAKDEPESGSHNKAKLDRIEEQLNKKYAGTTAFIRQFGVARFLPILLLDDHQNAEDVEKSYRLEHQAFVKTSAELINILRQARARTLNRLEEEKPHPNVKQLLRQWRHDQQPGRAIQWTLLHTNYVTQLPDTQQQALCIFQDTFESLIEKLDQDYESNINRSSKLGRIDIIARISFNSGDRDRLQRLLAMLQAHHDKKKATYFAPLLQGYLAELNNTPETAIKAYQCIIEGTAHIDALMRLFELHTKSLDPTRALEVLKTLADKRKGTYILMYADMLQATGNINAAVEAYTEYLLANPNDLSTAMKLGKLFIQCESVEGVTWSMDYILNKDPNNQEAQQILRALRLSVIPAETSKDSP